MQCGESGGLALGPAESCSSLESTLGLFPGLSPNSGSPSVRSELPPQVQQLVCPTATMSAATETVRKGRGGGIEVGLEAKSVGTI